jgi:hypothetical protein
MVSSWRSLATCASGQLHERLVAHHMGRSHAGAATGGLLEAHPAVSQLWLRTQIRKGRPREGQGGGHQPKGGAADMALSQVSVGGDAPVLHLDEGLQLVDEAGFIPGQKILWVVELVGGGGS